MKNLGTLLLLTSWGAACGDLPEVAPFGGMSRAIVNGTREPQSTFLTPGEVLSVVYLATADGSMFCSGTLIAPRAVVSAQHCTSSIEVGSDPSRMLIGFGTDPATPDALVPVAEINEHPSVDFALIILGSDATAVLPSVVPIALNRDPVTASWYGRNVDAAGYGDTYDETRTGRYFASVEVVDSDSETVTVDGHGLQGICYGDSGGPIIHQPHAGVPPVVVGTEQWGDSTCVGIDHLTRVDVVASFVDDRLSKELPPLLAPCDAATTAAGCSDGNAVWCKNGFLYTRMCAQQGLGCGYLGASSGYGCLPAECGDVDYYGVCNGATLSWCGRDGLSSQDCAGTGLICAVDEVSHVADCVKCNECNGVCTDMTTSVVHCGACNNPCLFAHATGHCEAGACVLDACDANYRDADGNAGNGCEESPDQGCAQTPRHPAVSAGILVVLWLARRRRR